MLCVAEEEPMNPDSLEWEQLLISRSPGSSPFAQCQEVQHSTEGDDADDQEGFPSTFVVCGFDFDSFF
jgi:hypothetical protein